MIKITQEDLHRLYVTEGMTLKAIAKIYNCNYNTISLKIRQYEIPIRNQSEWRGMKHYTGFFTRWSPEMAWVLGLLFTDGYIQEYSTSKRRCILSSIDLDMLESVREIVKTTNMPYKSQWQLYNLAVANSRDCLDLIALGCTRRKSHTMLFPNIPDKHLSHFIRGVWDGDGTIHIRRRKSYPEQVIGYVSGSNAFVEVLRDEIAENTGVYANIKTRQLQYSPYYVISYYQRNAIKILNWLYSDSTPNTRLARKYALAEPYLAL